MFKSGFLSFIYPHKSVLSNSLQKTISLEIIFMKINNNLNLIIPKKEQIILNKKLFNYLISKFEILLNNFNLIKKGIIQINFFWVFYIINLYSFKKYLFYDILEIF